MLCECGRDLSDLETRMRESSCPGIGICDCHRKFAVVKGEFRWIGRYYCPKSSCPADGRDLLDPECVPLVEAMNRLAGVKTEASCRGGKGHMSQCFFVSFEADSAGLFCIYKSMMNAVGGRQLTERWKIEVIFDNDSSEPLYVLRGPAGDATGAERIAAQILSFPSDERKTVAQVGCASPPW